MLNFVLLDDDASHNDMLEKMLKSACETETIDGRVVLKTTKADEVARFAEDFDKFAIYFLDIVLTSERLPNRNNENKINGLDVSKLIAEKSGQPNYIVYISAYSEYGIAGLHTHAFDFLVKPFKLEELCACLRAIMRDIEKREKITHIVEICGDKLSADHIFYIASDGNYSYVHTINGVKKYRARISDLSEALANDGFVRIHRKYTVNRRFIVEMLKKESACVLADQTELPVSKKYMGAVQVYIK